MPGSHVLISTWIKLQPNSFAIAYSAFGIAMRSHLHAPTSLCLTHTRKSLGRRSIIRVMPVSVHATCQQPRNSQYHQKRDQADLICRSSHHFLHLVQGLINSPAKISFRTSGSTRLASHRAWLLMADSIPFASTATAAKNQWSPRGRINVCVNTSPTSVVMV